MATALILHIDTSGPASTVMLAKAGLPVAVQRNEAEREHAGTINAMITSVMKEGGAEMQELSAIAVCSGPGSYTGLRIGMGTAKGLCYALDKPLILQNRLELLKGVPQNIMMAILPARAGEYFLAIYNKKCEELLQPCHALTIEVINYIWAHKVAYLCGEVGEDVVEQLEEVGIIQSTVIDVRFWADSSLSIYTQQLFSDAARAEPLYLKSVFIHKKS